MIFSNIDYFTFVQDIEVDGEVFDLHSDFVIEDYQFKNDNFILRLKHYSNAQNNLIISFNRAKILSRKKMVLIDWTISDIFRQQWVKQIDYSEQPNEMLIEVLFEGQEDSLILTCSEYEISKYQTTKEDNKD